MAKFDFAAYEAAGVFDENKAEQLYDNGISSEQAARPSSEEEGIGMYKATAGYKFANGDLALSEV
jgi:hypothetical protein